MTTTPTILGRGVYSFAEAAQLTGLKPARVREWFTIRPSRTNHKPIFRITRVCMTQNGGGIDGAKRMFQTQHESVKETRSLVAELPGIGDEAIYIRARESELLLSVRKGNMLTSIIHSELTPATAMTPSAMHAMSTRNPRRPPRMSRAAMRRGRATARRQREIGDAGRAGKTRRSIMSLPRRRAARPRCGRSAA